LKAGETANFSLEENRHTWVQVVKGSLSFNGISLHAGDGASRGLKGPLLFKAEEESEFLLFDLN
jgi:redox-sensitive bicupin YhaK (pirin superfamily)